MGAGEFFSSGFGFWSLGSLRGGLFGGRIYLWLGAFAGFLRVRAFCIRWLFSGGGESGRASGMDGFFDGRRLRSFGAEALQCGLEAFGAVADDELPKELRVLRICALEFSR